MTRFTVPIKDILNLSYYRYEITPSTLNPTINTAFTVTVTCTNVKGNAISGKELTLYYDGATQGAETTDSNGEATWTITPNSWGNHDLRVGNTHCQVEVDGVKWTDEDTQANPRWRIGRTETKGILLLNGWQNPSSTTSTDSYHDFSTTHTASNFKPISNANGVISSTNNYIITFRARSDTGVLQWKGIGANVPQNETWYGQIEWTINNSQR